MNTVEPIQLDNISHARKFLRLFLFETWEKIVLCHIYVTSREHKRSRRKQVIIRNFTNALESLADILDQKVTPYFVRLHDENSLNQSDFQQAVEVVNETARAVLNIHKYLYLLSGTSRAENAVTYDFIRKLEADTHTSAPDQHWLHPVPSIALTDSYNFYEYELSQLLPTSSAFYPGRGLVISLPRIEVDNPLMWSILAHEIAHVLLDRLQVVDRAIEYVREIYDRERTEQKQQFYNWVTETCADLIALRLLGPAYFCAFSTMGLLIENIPLSPSHPEFSHRIGNMSRYFRKTDTSFGQLFLAPNEHWDGVMEIGQLLLDALTYKNLYWLNVKRKGREVKREGDEPSGEEQPRVGALELDPLHYISVLDSYYLLPSPPQSLLQSHNSLCNYEPIVGYRNDDNGSSTLERLEQVESSEDLYRMLPLPEEPLSTSSILTSGWIYKMLWQYDKLDAMLVSEPRLLKALEWSKEQVTKRNELLQFSIGRAYMLQLYRDAQYSLKNNER